MYLDYGVLIQDEFWPVKSSDPKVLHENTEK